jgi:hypothetical protein
MASVLLPPDSDLIETDEDGQLGLAVEPYAWCLLAAKSEVYLSLDPKRPTHPYVLSFGTLEEALAFRDFFC